MTSPTLTFKIQSLYCAYAPQSGLFSFGDCFEEAVNSLNEQLEAHLLTEQKAVREGAGRALN